MHIFNNLANKNHVYLPVVTALNAEFRILKTDTKINEIGLSNSTELRIFYCFHIDLTAYYF